MTDKISRNILKRLYKGGESILVYRDSDDDAGINEGIEAKGVELLPKATHLNQSGDSI